MRDGPQSLLIAMDFSENGVVALMQGFDSASQLRKKPHVLHVCHEISGRLLVDRNGAKQLLTPELAQRLVADHVNRCLARYLALGRAAAFDIVVSHIAAGEPANSIVKFADELQVSLIVIGASQASGRGRSLGSTVATVVRDASVPVLVAHQATSSAEVAIEPACPACMDVRGRSNGSMLWCQYHGEPQTRRHTYHYPDEHQCPDRQERLLENLPRLFPMARGVARALERG